MDGKKYPEKCFFDFNLHFYEEKNISFCNFFLIFEFFSNSEAWLQNLRLIEDFSEFFGLFDTYTGP